MTNQQRIDKLARLDNRAMELLMKPGKSAAEAEEMVKAEAMAEEIRGEMSRERLAEIARNRRATQAA